MSCRGILEPYESNETAATDKTIHIMQMDRKNIIRLSKSVVITLRLELHSEPLRRVIDPELTDQVRSHVMLKSGEFFRLPVNRAHKSQ
jgi:hypothetical protein